MDDVWLITHGSSEYLKTQLASNKEQIRRCLINPPETYRKTYEHLKTTRASPYRCRCTHTIHRLKSIPATLGPINLELTYPNGEWTIYSPETMAFSHQKWTCTGNCSHKPGPPDKNKTSRFFLIHVWRYLRGTPSILSWEQHVVIIKNKWGYFCS